MKAGPVHITCPAAASLGPDPPSIPVADGSVASSTPLWGDGNQLLKDWTSSLKRTDCVEGKARL